MSGLTFQSPLGALVALAVVFPLAALVAFERRARRVRHNVQLPEPEKQTHTRRIVALCVLAALLGLAATHPALTRTSKRSVRTDAQAWALFDTSASMSARQQGGPSRFERSKRLAIQLRNDLPDIPFGVASFAEDVLPHMFPSSDANAFASTVRNAVQIGSPPSPNVVVGTVGTSLSAITAFGSDGYFAPSATHKLLIVFSDDESSPVFGSFVAAELRNKKPIHVIFVHVWNGNERIYLPNGRPDPGYTPDPSSYSSVSELASEIGGSVYSESDTNGILDQARADLGTGSHRPIDSSTVTTPLARWLLILAFIPLAFVLRARDLFGSLWQLGVPGGYALRRRRESGSLLRPRRLASFTISKR
ncbi:MAG TPA: VWA domain-containing protein [Gaiellaceae bacterium]|nr:VWA domain-containing protein [Gaiellaceae bacterium]